MQKMKTFFIFFFFKIFLLLLFSESTLTNQLKCAKWPVGSGMVW